MALVCLSDFEAYAKKHLPKATWDFFAAGADECCTRDDNIMAFKRIRFRPRMLRDMSAMDTKTTILGTEISFPVGIAPTGFHKLAWPDGELSTARAAEAMNTCYIASTYSSCSVEEIAAAAPAGFRWFQLYVLRKRNLTEQLVKRVEALGFQALVLTADLPYPGKRRDDIRNNFSSSAGLPVKNFEGAFEGEENTEYGLPAGAIDCSLNWNDIYWLQSLTHLPLIIKGILTKEDAELAVKYGVQGIIVSNHGGRQLDGAPATIDALAEIVTAVQDKVAVYLDGGIRTGGDVLKALALGAKCVFIGRPALWGLAYKSYSCGKCNFKKATMMGKKGSPHVALSEIKITCGALQYCVRSVKDEGEEGLQEVLKILRDEFRLSMALAGCRNVSEIGPHLLQYSRL